MFWFRGKMGFANKWILFFLKEVFNERIIKKKTKISKITRVVKMRFGKSISKLLFCIKRVMNFKAGITGCERDTCGERQRKR